MPIQNKFERTEADSPERCQSVVANGQCPFKVMEGSKYCPMHGGTSAQRSKEKESIRLYRLGKWQARVNEIGDHDKVKSLREEIGIARVLLEETLMQCQDTGQLLLYSNKISDLVTRIEKLVSSCHRLEASTGLLLDKAAAIHLASVIVEIISEHITDQDALDNVANHIIGAIINHKTEEKK